MSMKNHFKMGHKYKRTNTIIKYFTIFKKNIKHVNLLRPSRIRCNCLKSPWTYPENIIRLTVISSSIIIINIECIK